MAFDQGTRGELQKFVTDIRKLLTDDFTRQLQQTYGMDPVSGEVAPLDSLKHLDDERLETAQILRDVMDLRTSLQFCNACFQLRVFGLELP